MKVHHGAASFAAYRAELEEKRLNMARPTRGVVRDALQRQFERAEARLRGRIADLQGKGSDEAPSDGVEE